MVSRRLGILQLLLVLCQVEWGTRIFVGSRAFILRLLRLAAGNIQSPLINSLSTLHA